MRKGEKGLKKRTFLCIVNGIIDSSVLSDCDGDSQGAKKALRPFGAERLSTEIEIYQLSSTIRAIVSTALTWGAIAPNVIIEHHAAATIV